MANLSVLLSEYVKNAKAAMAMSNWSDAQQAFLKAAECALLLAKQTTGKEREKNLAYFQSIKELLAQLQPKLQSTAPTAPAAPAAPVTPAAPTPAAPAPASAAPSDAARERSAYTPPKRNDALSPQYLNDYIGQPQAVTAVRDLISAALLKKAALPHLILYGSHGLGKTTFAKIIANEMRTSFTEVNVSKITPADMLAILKNIKPRDIVFIDEIHTLPLVVAESLLYSAMQDGRVTYTEGKGKFAKTETIELPPFTLIGATTEIGKLAKPFTQRAIQIRLEEYSDEIIGGIITKSFYKLGMSISAELALHIAKRCRNNPRIANNMVKRISDKALVRYATINNLTTQGSLDSVDAIRRLNIQISQQVIDDFFKENGIDEYGLESGDRELLKMIIHRYKGGPVGIDTLARAMNESNNVLAQKYEAYLIKKGMLRIDREGRVVMPAAYIALGMTPPSTEGTEGTPEDTEGEGKATKYGKRQMIACHVPDTLKCEKLEELITYPDNVRVVEDNLDALFPDVTKPYEGETRHQCELEIDFDGFKRNLICDSFLESRFAKCMAAVGFLKDIKAQTLEIPYISQALADRRYFPDFVIKDYRGRIAVIEMKNYDMATYHLNIDKYEQLRQYCIQHGYGYAEVMKAYNADTYLSTEMLMAAPVDRELEQHIISVIDADTGNGMFTEEDWQAYVAEHPSITKSELHTILLHNRRLKNVDRTGTNIKIITN